MVYTQGAPNIFDSYLNGDANKSTAAAKRVKGSYMQGTIASGKKHQQEAVAERMLSAL